MGVTSEIFPSQHATVKPAQAGPAITEHFAMDNLKVSKFRGKPMMGFRHVMILCYASAIQHLMCQQLLDIMPIMLCKSLGMHICSD